MSFFYDLNKRLADLAGKQDAQQLAENTVSVPRTKSQLAESMGVAEANYSAKKAAAGKDIGKPGKNFSKIAKGAAERYGSKAAGERVAGAVLNKLRHPKESAEEHGDVMDYLNDKLKDFDAQQATKEGNAFTGKLASTPKGGKFDLGGKKFKDTSSIEEADIVGFENAMTPKQKSFAKLAPPTDKITFADKIAGAKKEVDEMLGDVAAEAIKGAIGKKKEPRSKGTAFDADFMKQQQAKKDAESHSRYDVQDTGYSKRYTRKAVDTDIDTDDEVKSDEPKKKGRPKGADKGPERTTKGAWKHKGDRKVKAKEDLDTDGVMMTRQTNCSSESVDRGEYDREGEMAKNDIKTIVRHAQALHKVLGDDDNLPEWVQSKLAKIEGMMTAVDDYMQNHSDGEEAIAEKAVSKKNKPESTDTEDQRAEKAGKKVAKDIEYDEGHKGKDDNKAEKAGKKVTKDIEYDDKKDKEEKVKESNKGGYNFGGGIYENLDKKVENMIAEGMSINISIDEQGKKSISVNATDEDAEALAQLLKMAGLEGNKEEICPSCGSASCGCDAEMVDENQPDWPTNTETSNDALQYSGGLNKPKSTGQTTIPVIASQQDRLHTMEENVELERSLFKTWKNYKG